MLKNAIKKNIHLSVSDGLRGVLEAAPDSALFKIPYCDLILMRVAI